MITPIEIGSGRGYFEPHVPPSAKNMGIKYPTKNKVKDILCVGPFLPAGLHSADG